jgi:hypothetical protein
MRNHLLIAAAAAAVFTAAASGQVINEFSSNPAGTDPADQDIELLGNPGASFAGTLITIESDSNDPGTIDSVNEVNGAFDASGLAVVRIPDFENPAFTFVLLDGTGLGLSVGTDLDTDDDGTPESAPAGLNVLDAIGVPDSASSDVVYGAALGGTDFAFTGAEPELLFRDSGTGTLYAVNDLDSTTDIEAFAADGTAVLFSAFDLDPRVPTFGSINPAVPEPASLGLLAAAGLGLIRRRSA